MGCKRACRRLSRPTGFPGESVLLLLVSWVAGASANAPHPLSLQSQLAPNPRGCPLHTVYMESSVWWTTDNMSLPNATNYGRITMTNCWPHMAVFTVNYPMFPVTTIESAANYSLSPDPGATSPQGNGSLVIVRSELAYQTGIWLDPCPFKYFAWRPPARGYPTCAASNGTYAPGGDSWTSTASSMVLGLIAGQTNGWPTPAVSAQAASSRKKRTARGLLQLSPSPPSPSPTSVGKSPSGWLQVCPQDVSKIFTSYVSMAQTAAASKVAAAQSTCAPNCPFCGKPFVNNTLANSSSSQAIAPVLPMLQQCMYMDNLTFDSARYPYPGQVAADAGFFVYPRVYLTNPNEKTPFKVLPGNGVRGFELVAGFGMIMHKTKGPLNMKRIQKFHYNRHDSNEVSVRVTAPMQGSTAAHIRPAWKVPIFGDIHWYLRVFDCMTDHGGSPMEQWTLALNADPVNGVAGMVIASGTRFYTGMLHVDTSALGLTSGWYSACVIITARDPDTLALKTTIHRHWFQILTDFPVQPNTLFIMYPNVNIPSVVNWTDIDPRPNVLSETSVHVGTKAFFYPKTHWTMRYRAIMTFNFTDMKNMRCGFSSVTLYMFLKRIVMTAQPGWEYGTNTTMIIDIWATADPSYFPPGIVRKSWKSMMDPLTRIGSLRIGLQEDTAQWHGIVLSESWINQYVYGSQATILTFVVSTPAILDQHFYFAAVQDADSPKPGPGYQPFLSFVPNC